MAFTGKATYSAGAALPEVAEDVSDIIGIVSPYETPLLDHLGDPARAARSTRHEWLEDELLPNTDRVSDAGFSDPAADTSFDVAHGERFRVGDQVQAAGSGEVMLVAAVSGETLSVQRGYGGTTPEALADGRSLRILGNAALEGGDRPAARFTNRVRRTNWTQIFTAGVEVSGTELAVRQIGLDDELDYQKQERLRELARDLENCVINGVAAEASPQGGGAVRRTMDGIIPRLTSNAFVSGAGDFPGGEGTGGDELSERQVNTALRRVWERSSGRVDTILVSGVQKRRINGFITPARRYEASATRFRDMVGTYESDFGLCRVVLSRWVPSDAVLLLDSARIGVLPLGGRSFHYKPEAARGDLEAGQVIGEYTLELRNENAHGMIRGLASE